MYGFHVGSCSIVPCSKRETKILKKLRDTKSQLETYGDCSMCFYLFRLDIHGNHEKGGSAILLSIAQTMPLLLSLKNHREFGAPCCWNHTNSSCSNQKTAKCVFIYSFRGKIGKLFIIPLPKKKKQTCWRYFC